ncbi:MAG: MBL fold metallo-hydrolase [Planctomycetota bacterium]
MEVAPGIHRFATGDFNWYVVDDGGRLTVVDCGWPRHYGVLIRGLAAMGRSVADVEAVLLTHAHADHTGFAERLRRAADATVWVHEADRAMAEKRGQLPWAALVTNAWRRQTRSMLIAGGVSGVFRLPRVAETRTFDDGQTLDVPGRPTVIHTPGHTPGQVSFHLPDRRAVVCGDTLLTLDLLTGETTPPRLAFDALNAAVDTARDSLSRLRGLGEVTVLTGHGPPWRGELDLELDRIAAR